MSRVKILIADDHTLMREGMRRILSEEPDFEVIAEASDGEETVNLATTLEPDIAIIDIEMPKINGIEATKQIKAACPSIAVLILTAYDDDEYVFGLIEAGVAGYLLKGVRGQELVNAVRALHKGESVLHPSITSKVLKHVKDSSTKQTKEKIPDSLTRREKDILRLAMKGMSNKEIGEELYLSYRTVQGHLSHIFSKLKVASRTEAVVYALREGLFNDIS